MKIHSFYVETSQMKVEKNAFYKIVQALNRSEFGSIDQAMEPSRPKFNSLVYFWLAPTLIYRDQYPR